MAKKTVRIILLSVAAMVALYCLWLVRGGLYPFYIAFFLAYILNPAVSFLEKRGVRRVWAICIVYLALFFFLVIGGSYLVPIVIRELESFARELPFMTIKTEELLQAFQWKYQNSALPLSLRAALDDSLVSLQGVVQDFVVRVVAAILGLLSHFIGLVISPILAFYLLHDWHVIGAQLLRILPGQWRHETISLLRDMDRVLSGVIRGQLTIALAVGILVTTGLYLLGVRFAVIIGILAGLLDVIPYFGAFIGATPAVTVALLDSPLLALKVAALFFAIHQLEGTVIGPKILGENVGLHPLTVIFFLFIGEETAGLVGMLLGVPLAALGKVVLQHLFKALI